MARSVSLDTILLDHLSWESDALLISTPKHKVDQEEITATPISSGRKQLKIIN
jgi:hypothetical protein